MNRQTADNVSYLTPSTGVCFWDMRCEMALNNVPFIIFTY